ncbi:MAG TPA: AmmeMemoRadiSam system protein B [Rubrivivax sp.]|nr:AmmeMemoRadiSam system protein B [Rubrivivax sp.]
MRRLVITLLACLAPAAQADVAAVWRAYPVDPQQVLQAIAGARPVELGGAAVTGLVLPHHRVASDLIASGMVTAARGAQPERIVLLTPDHFRRATRAFATTPRDFDTVLGRVAVDRRAVAALLRSPQVAASPLFEREHGIGELLPYVARLFPGVPMLPVAVRIGATRAQWEHMAAQLAPWVTPRTLIIQSTDFSHYLTQEQARRHDQQMLHVIAAGDLDAMARALQPAHLDSRGGQYIQMRLQAQRFGAQPIVFGNTNSAERGATGPESTTSCIAQLYAPAARERVVLAPSAVHSLCVAGDAFFGRHVAGWLRSETVRQRVFTELRRRLQGCPLLVNLEGVLGADGRAAHPLQLAMPAAQTLAWLRELGVVAVSVANNHSRDLGDAAYARMVAQLRGAGLQVLEHGRPQAVGPLRVAAWTDLDNAPSPRRELITPQALQQGLRPDELPELALLHWGREFVAAPGARERALAQRLQSAGVPIVAGAHPHRASRRIELLGGLDAVWVPSLGNFVFDQRAPRASGAVLHISRFAQGTRALRLIALPDVFELGRDAGR